MNKVTMKILVSLCFLFAISYVVAAQGQIPRPSANAVSIGDTRISRDEQDLVVDYQIILGEDVLSCEVEVVINADGRPVRTYGFNDLKGDFGKITTSGSKQVRFNVEHMKNALADKAITFTLNVTKKDVLENNIMAMASVSVFPQPSYGLMLGYVRKVGGYAKFRSDFGSADPSYECYSDGTTDSGCFWASGSQKKTRVQATAGLLLRATGNVFPYIGAGYGSRGVYWEDASDQWAQVADYSCKGIAAEAGLIFKIGQVAFSAGVSSTAFKYVEAEVGIGLMF